MWTWRTAPTGIVQVDRTGSGTFEAITLPGPDAATRRTETWLPLVEVFSAKYGVPVAWVLAVIYAESRGEPNARNSCCGGLMQLSRATWHLTEAQSLDPTTNVDLGTKILGGYRASGHDLPTCASMYNAGPTKSGAKHSSKSVWGMVEDMPAVPWTGYIEKVVRASNWWIMHGFPQMPTSTTQGGQTTPTTPSTLGSSGLNHAAAALAVAGAAAGAFMLTQWLLGARGGPLRYATSWA